jgi:hypothetical protein
MILLSFSHSLTGQVMAAECQENYDLLFFEPNQTDTLHRMVQLSFSETLGERSNLFLTDFSEWSVSNDQNIILRGTGTELNSQRFEIPGNYNIRIFEKHIHVEVGCVHPDQLHLIKLNVASSKAELVYDQSFWHQILSTKKSFAGDTLLLPIRVRYYGEAMPIQNLQISLAGVNCTLKGIQNGEVVLPPNETTLVPFVLYGNVGSGIFAMLDFIDQNGNTATNSITQIIK